MRQFGQIITTNDVRMAQHLLARVKREHGLGVALLVTHLHGLRVGHIPVPTDIAGKATLINTEATTLPLLVFRFAILGPTKRSCSAVAL